MRCWDISGVSVKSTTLARQHISDLPMAIIFQMTYNAASTCTKAEYNQLDNQTSSDKTLMTSKSCTQNRRPKRGFDKGFNFKLIISVEKQWIRLKNMRHMISRDDFKLNFDSSSKDTPLSAYSYYICNINWIASHLRLTGDRRSKVDAGYDDGICYDSDSLNNCFR